MHFKRIFSILSLTVITSGLSQGMLLPLISIIFDQRGIPAELNGLHATGLYIGILVTSLFIEIPLQRFGYMKLIVSGGFIVTVSLLLFPFLDNIWIWFVLRLFIGIGDNMLHFASQTWVTHIIPKPKLGRYISLYGLCFSVGFMLGPLLTQLSEINLALPFVVSSVLTLFSWIGVVFIGQYAPATMNEYQSIRRTFIKFRETLKVSWIAFLFPMLYGILESSLSSNFPVFALHYDVSIVWISYIIAAFSLGSIIFQYPIGTLSDSVSRKSLMIWLLVFGAGVVFLGEFFMHSPILLLLLFIVIGALLGSMFSLGMSFMAEITPKDMLPSGNLLCGIAFSVGSMFAPYIGGVVIEQSNHTVYFTFISILIIIILLLLLIYPYEKIKQIQLKKMEHE